MRVYFNIYNQFSCFKLVLSITKNNTVTERVQIAFESVFIASAILVTFSLLGNYIFGYLKISYPALDIAGGIILFLVALKMLFEDPSSETASIDSSNRVSIFPLAVPLLAGAASITSVIVIMNELQGDLLNQTLIISALLTVMLITLAVFYILARTGKFINNNITNVISKVMAIILSGLSIQFIINGIKAINF